MTFKLVTDDFSLKLDRKFRLDLIDNFKKIETEVLKFEELYKILPAYVKTGDLDKLQQQIKELKQQLEKSKEEVDQQLSTGVQELDDKLSDRIKRILLGTDTEAIEIVVDKILKDKGVI